MAPGISFSGRSLLFAFAAVVISFVGATTYTSFSSHSIDDAAMSIAGNAMPSIENLAAARTEMRRLQVLLEQHLDELEAGRSTLRPEIERARGQLESYYRAYLLLPTFPGEEALWVRIQSGLKTFDSAVAVALDDMATRRLRDAQNVLTTRVAPAGDTAADALMNAIEFNAQHAHELAMHVEDMRRHATAVAFGLDAIAAMLTVLAGLLALRAVRQSTAAIEAHSRLAEQRADELEQFAGRVAHDILSPLSTASVVLGIVERQLPEDQKRRDVIQRGQHSLERVKRIVDGLLEFARSGARPDPSARADVQAVATDVCDGLAPQAEEAMIELTSDVPAGLTVTADEGVLTSAISNLVRNAIKYMGNANQRRVKVTASERGGSVRVEVEDTGPGLPPDVGERSIFEPYVRGRGSNQPGIGLGLATVKRIVDAHGGRIGVRSNPGKGCLFWFELPRAKAMPAGTAPSEHRPLHN